jgi:hypothetical protein
MDGREHTHPTTAPERPGAARRLTIRIAAALGLVAGGLAPLIVAGPPASAAVTVTSHFIWTATSSNIGAYATFIDNAATNNNPNALLFVTPSYEPGGVCGCVTDPAPIGVEWGSGVGKWVIINMDTSSMPVGAAFNVLVVQKPSAQVFTVTSTSSSTSGNSTTFSNPATDGKGGALLQVTQSLPQGTNSPLNSHPVGVIYGLGSGGNLWDIQNLDNAAMPVGATFNVMVGAKASNGGAAVLLKGFASNTVAGDTNITNAETDGNPNAVVFDTQNDDPNLHFGVVDPAPTGVAYRNDIDKVAVFNENGTTMPTTKHFFNLLIFPS